MAGPDKERSADPRHPHRFVRPRDPRSGFAAAGVQPDLQQMPALAVAYATLHSAPCAMQGCGLPRDNAIHDLEE